jgi:hypothetical protein
LAGTVTSDRLLFARGVAARGDGHRARRTLEQALGGAARVDAAETPDVAHRGDEDQR